MIAQNKKRILVYACDPGGANVVIPVAQACQNRGFEVLLYGKDAALKKYQDAGLLPTDLKNLDAAAIKSFMIQLKPDCVITGTSANDFTEKYLWATAQELKIQSYAILDQWMNNDIRFSPYPLTAIELYQKNRVHTFLPSTIFVLDDFVKHEMLEKGFAEERLVVTGHTHLEAIAGRAEALMQEREQYRKVGSDHIFTIVFFSEPIEQTYGKTYWGYTEKSIFQQLYDVAQRLSIRLSKNIKILIKHHPREAPDNLNVCVRDDRVFCIVTNTFTVWDLFVQADVVCGMSSMALLEAMVLGLPVVSIQIGLQRPDPFMPSVRGINHAILDQRMLEKKIESIILGNVQTLPKLQMCTGAVDRIIKKIGRGLC